MYRAFIVACLIILFPAYASAQDQPGQNKFPVAANSAASLIETADNARTTLKTALVANASSMTVLSTLAFPATGLLVVDGRSIVSYTGKTSTTFTGLIWGLYGTPALTFASGVSVEMRVLAAEHNILSTAIRSHEAKIGTGASTPSPGKFFKGTGIGQSAWGLMSVNDLPIGGPNQFLKTNQAGNAVENATLSIGTSGNDINIAFGANSVAVNVPNASATARGVISTGPQTIAGAKTFTDALKAPLFDQGGAMFNAAGYPSLQAAIDAAVAAGKNAVVIPAGDYHITSHLVIGNGNSTTASTVQGFALIGTTGGLPLGAATSGLVNIIADNSMNEVILVNGPMGGLRIENVHINCNALAQTGIRAIHTRRSTFKNIEITENTGSGFVLDGYTSFSGAGAVGQILENIRIDSGQNGAVGFELGVSTMVLSDVAQVHGINLVAQVSGTSAIGVILRGIDASIFSFLDTRASTTALQIIPPTGAPNFPDGIALYNASLENSSTVMNVVGSWTPGNGLFMMPFATGDPGETFPADTRMWGLSGDKSWHGALRFNDAVTFTASPSFSTLTTNSVPYAGASGLLSQDNSNFTFDATNKTLLLGGPTSSNTAERIHIATTAANSNPQLVIDDYKSSAANPFPMITTRAARGTPGSPSAIAIGDPLLLFTARGYHSGAAFGGNAGVFRFEATDNFASGAQGTAFTIETTTTGTASRVTRLRVEGDGGITVPDTVTGGSKGAGTLNAAGLYINGVAVATGTSFGSPTASVGLSSIPGSATTAMRSDAAPALDQSIAPTMTGLWTFTPTVSAGNGLAVTGTPTSGNLVNIAASGTGAASNTKTGLNVSMSGANGANQTTYGAQFSNTSTGTGSTNIAAKFTASGGSTNISALFSGIATNTTTLNTAYTPVLYMNGTTILDGGSTGGNVTPLVLAHPTTYNSGAEIQIDFAQSGVLGRIANYYSGAGGLWGLKFYSYSGGALNSTPALTLAGDQLATFAGNIVGATLIGGPGTTSTLALRSTSGAGTTGADIIFQAGTNGATELGRFENDGTFRIGIGGATIGKLLETHVTQGGAINSSLVLHNNSNTAATGAGQLFSAINASSAQVYLGGLAGQFTDTTAGAEHADLIFREMVAGTLTSVGRFSKTNLKIGGTAFRGTTEGTNHIDLYDGTAPAGTMTNGVSFYSASGEARVMDAAGNSTLLSPHDHVTNEWIFYSVNTVTGKVLKIDMERMMRALDVKLGGGFIHEYTNESQARPDLGDALHTKPQQ